jgi:hypothetical protein
MKLSLRGTPREVKALLDRLEVQIAMLDVSLRMTRLAIRCGRTPGMVSK